MPIMENYLVKAANLHTFLNTLLNAQAPDKFTIKFLEQLGFTSTNDRLLIGLLKGLGFLDGTGTPTQRYYRFLDQAESKTVLAEAIRDAYTDLFAINTKAYTMTATEVKGKFKTITQGAKSDNVLDLMAKTFKSLCEYADFSTSTPSKELVKLTHEEPINQHEEPINQHEEKTGNEKAIHEMINKKITTEMHYNIQIHLPETRDISVYDAIFKSLKEHLL